VTQKERLVIVSPVATSEASRGGFVLTQKFIDGVTEMQKHWGGAVRVLVPRAAKVGNDLDHREVRPGEVDFELAWFEAGAVPIEQLGDATVVLATLIHEQTALAHACTTAAPRIPIVFMTEYALRTRMQILSAETTNPLLRWRRQWWTKRLEKRYVEAVRLASGLQCNGTPTFDAYRAISPRPLLFFDSRIRQDMVVPLDVLEARTRQLMQGAALRLAFSGRLIRMKGAHHLPRVASELKQLGVSFTLDICGGGALEGELRQAIEARGLKDCVRMRGVLDFERELVPFVSSSVDLFVCCHPQGDPSCTYLETMACGTPIVGYANEAFAGIAEVSGVGWSTAMNEPAAMAHRIAALAQDRAALVDAATKSRSFALQHTFEQTMEQRAAHLHDCAESRQAIA
jgi:glycosyltransferase involved in cell wall biosynthesis